MGFDYDRIKAQSTEGGTFWTAYSDLFTVLSTIFLTLYVITSVHTGTFSIQKHAEYQKLAKRAEDLEQQIKVYNALRDEQAQQSSEEEQKAYAKLMDKLSLLQEQNKDERDKLIAQAKENNDKAEALNQYQQMIRNIINVNMLAKRQIKQRDTLIATKDTQLFVSENQVQALSTEVKQKEQVIAQNNQRIDQIHSELESQIKRAIQEQKHAKSSKSALEKKIAAMRDASERKVSELESTTQKVASELSNARRTLEATTTQLQQAQATTEQVKQQSSQEKAAAAQERATLLARLEGERAEYGRQMEGLKGQAAQQLAAERAEFERNLAHQKLSAAARAKKEGEFRAQAERNAADLQGKIAALGNKIKGTEGELEAERQKGGRYVAAIGDLKKQNADISDKLARARELAEAKKKLIQEIRDNFSRAGVKADVDEKTGEVTLAFGDDYFESGSSDLKPTMRARLEKFIPSYTQGIFSDPKTAENIANVEIIGFASSTYKGKYVNPQSLNPQDREAVDYNLKLSFNRANAIFKHIFDPKKLSYQHQQELLPLVKVVGRGYLPDGKTGSDIPAGLPESKFCEKFNCKKAQRVIIKFNMKD